MWSRSKHQLQKARADARRGAVHGQGSPEGKKQDIHACYSRRWAGNCVCSGRRHVHRSQEQALAADSEDFYVDSVLLLVSPEEAAMCFSA